METQPKIRIIDDATLRTEIDSVYENTEQVVLAKWSLLIAKHLMEILGIDYTQINVVVEGFKITESWQVGEARMHDVRQVGFKIHKVTHESNLEIEKVLFNGN